MLNLTRLEDHAPTNRVSKYISVTEKKIHIYRNYTQGRQLQAMK